jgi:hypothetical protein
VNASHCANAIGHDWRFVGNLYDCKTLLAPRRTYNRAAHLSSRREMVQRRANYLNKLRIGADVITLRKVI